MAETLTTDRPPADDGTNRVCTLHVLVPFRKRAPAYAPFVARMKRRSGMNAAVLFAGVSRSVIPAQAGICPSLRFIASFQPGRIPAFAGMTLGERWAHGCLSKTHLHWAFAWWERIEAGRGTHLHSVMPAEAGTHDKLQQAG